MSKLQAVILAGGKGSRLKPYTAILPKPLIPVGGYPIMEVIIRQLKYYGFRDIIISVGYLAELIESYFGDGKRWGIDISYIKETRPLGTAGALRLIKGLQDDFLVINGDTLTNMDFKKAFDFHRAKKSKATIAVKKVTSQVDFGVVTFKNDMTLSRYQEKPKNSLFLSLGINILNKRAVSLIKANETLGMPDLMLRAKKSFGNVYCYEIRDVWHDLGRMPDLSSAERVFLSRKKDFLK